MSSAYMRAFRLPPKGMENLRNTCFFNASIQCLLSIVKMNAFFLENEFNHNKQPICSAYKDFITKYKDCASAVEPTMLIAALRKKVDLFNGHQQDAGEFMILFLDRISGELEKLDKNMANEFNSIFQTSLTDTVTCSYCSTVIKLNVKEVFLQVYLNTSVEKSIANFTKQEEKIDQATKWECVKCKKAGYPIFKHTISETSDYLFVYLKRFTSRHTKNSSATEISDPIIINNEKFNLTSVVCHSGSLQGGHYYSYCNREQWVRYDDSLTHPTDSFDVSSSGYILLYTKS